MNCPLQSTHNRPPIIGLVGGVAAGKSAVARILAELGAYIIDADQLGHEVLGNEVVRAELVAKFGAAILLPDQSIDRRAVAHLVFGSENESQLRRRQLESIVHPRIRELASTCIDAALAQAKPPKSIVLDAPLLIEAGWKSFCDHILFVDTSDASRLTRGIRRGWTESQFRQRELAQLPVEEKRKYASHVVDNNGSIAELRRQTHLFWTSIGLAVP